MLKLVDIKKDYTIAGGAVHALKGISLNFRRNEFVSILGASGCGKTTLLNIIGGLDKYTSGDLIIEGKSTKEYSDGDWDTYRNHSIGFIFQSYHLIPHQTILQNVELALTISGVSKDERKNRAVEALEKVGLADKLNTRPNQLSGGQAQRVAIARALINDPEIVLADEPTGALDSKTSVQIMELLKEISRDRLVIMVTHNPELAEQYSTRIIRLLDGLVTDDTMPYDGVESGDKKDEESAKVDDNTGSISDNKKNKGKKKHSAMSVGMAFMLSLKNLLSKRKRTTMVSVAGSIGIIGVSMVLAISSGVTAYISDMENDMLSGYPVSITRSAIDYSSLMNMSTSTQPKVDITKLKDKLYVQSLMDTLGNFAQGVTKTNEITEEYLYYVERMDKKLTNVVQYGYDFNLTNNIYTDFKVDDGTEEASQVTSVAAIRGMYAQILSEQKDYENFAGTISSVATFEEVPSNYEYVLSQFDILAAETSDGVTYDASTLTNEQKAAIFNDKQTLIMVVDNSMVTDLALGQYGYLSQKEFLNYAYKAVGSDAYDSELGLIGSGMKGDEKDPENGLAMSKFIGDDSKKFTWYPNDEAYVKYDGTAAGAIPQMDGQYFHKPYLKDNFFSYSVSTGVPPVKIPLNSNIDESKGVELGVKLILQKKSNISYSCLSSGIYYTKALTDHMRADSAGSRIVQDIQNSENKYLDYLPYSFYYTAYSKDGEETKKETKEGTAYIYDSGNIMDMLMSGLGGDTDKTKMLRVTAEMLGGGDFPSSIYIYPTNFDTKNIVTDYLDKWNEMCEQGETYTYVNADGTEVSVELSAGKKITYTDTVGLIINMVNTMIQMITIALVAFTALSLVVSTVMVGIITYVSVVERIKEIGILRAVGARKKDIKRLFNAETFIIGLAAGIVGIAVTYILSLILNITLGSLFGIFTIAALPWWQALVMIGVSVVLTLISGLIPAAAAAKKDPVVALRTE